MSIGYSTNLFALRALRQLGANSYQLGSALNRLSSGSRINRPSDDAAGLAVASTLGLRQRVYSQGIRNANDAISMLNIASGAVGELSGVLVRLKELAEQAANGTLSLSQRRALDTEAHALTQEYNRIIGGTKFNGLGLLNLHTRNVTAQLGFGNDEGITTTLGAGLSYAAGNGAFTAIGDTGIDSGVEVLTGDFNGDGIDDYASAEGGSGLKIYFGDGNFGVGGVATISTASGDDVGSAAAGDIDGDGDLDVVLGTADGQIEIYKNNGAGTFTNTSSTVLSVIATVDGIRLGDLNNDGVLDVVASQGTSIRSFVAASDGSISGFGTLVGTGTRNFDLGDFNGDGILDVVTPQAANTDIHAFYGNGSGSFSGNNLIGFATAKNGIVKVGDFNHDGLDDVISTGGSSATFKILTSTGSAFTSSSTTALSGAVAGVEIADINGDGFLDFVASGTTFVDVLLGNDDSTFDPKVSSTISGGVPALGDFNGDGVQDLLTYIKGLNTDLFMYQGVGQDSTNIARINLLDRQGALEALGYIDEIMEKVQRELGSLGSSLSRLQSGLSNLEHLVLGYDTAKSRIVDSDVATETAELVRTQILQDTIAAVLSQATQQPALVLDLLRAPSE
ncbi:MAG: FG-GAP-like repeat-containing protein [Bdellovibrionota bacterium]|nr:MAG: FG-GAP-like repeat-containing protein [Bdellovibrionota bacterium]